MTDSKTIDKLKLLAALDDIVRSPESAHEKDLYKEKFPSDLEKKLEELRKAIKEGTVETGNLSADQKKTAKIILLTHYLTYICNRRDSAKRVFDEGGAVFLRIVISFLKKREITFDDWFRNCINKNKLCFKDPDDKTSEIFKAHLMDEEAAGVYSFLSYLDEKRKIDEESLSWKEDSFFGIFNKTGDTPIREIFDELEKITCDFEYFRKKGTKNKIRKEFVMFLNSDLDSKFGTKNEDYKSKPHGRKRLWCCLRDFFYNSDFSDLLEAVIGSRFFKNLKEHAEDLELPGDVYNNDPRLAKCIWGDAVDEKQDGTFSSSQFIRKQYKNQKDELEESPGWIPINYDVSFLYVQNMCRRSHCSECPLRGEVKEQHPKLNKARWGHLCHKKKGSFCIYVSVALGIFYECPGDNCKGKDAEDDRCKICPIVENSLIE